MSDIRLGSTVMSNRGAKQKYKRNNYYENVDGAPEVIKELDHEGNELTLPIPNFIGNTDLPI